MDELNENQKNNTNPTIQTTFDSIVKAVIGKKVKDNLSGVDDVLDRVTDAVVDKNSFKYAEMIRASIGKVLTRTDKWDVSEFAQDTVVSDENRSRFQRYINAQEITDSIPYCARALKVISDGIMSPDDITKEIIQVIGGKDLTEKDKNKVGDIRALKDQLELERLIPDIILDTLKFGDQFVEFANFKTEDIPITQVMLTEQGSEVPDHPILFNYVRDNGEEASVSIELITESNFTDKPSQKDKKDAKENSIADDIKTIVHDPRTVLKIQSKRFNFCLGYLIIPLSTAEEAMSSVGSSNNNAMGSSSIASKIMKRGLTSGSGGELEGVDKLYKELVGAVTKFIGTIRDVDINKKELRNLLKKLVQEIKTAEDPGLEKIQIRYIPPDRMEHFFINEKRFFPYGESIFYKSMWQAKLLIALQTAATIKRISDSSEKRLYYIDSSQDRQVRNVISDFMEKTKKRKVSVDSWGNISSIPSMITSYEEYYVPKPRGGEPVITFDKMDTSVNIRDVTDELKFFRDMLVSSLDVPPAYMNLEENLCLSLSTPITYVDGSRITLREFISNFKENSDNIYIHSYDHKTGKVVPGKVTWAGITRTNADVVRVTLDNYEYIDCTPDHKFMLRDGSYKEAQYLEEGDSLMPLYMKNTNIKATNGLPYQMVYNPGLDKWQLRYQAFADALGLKYGKGYVIHHKDGNPTNDHPCNLQSCSFREHAIIHRDWGKHRLHSDGQLHFIRECKVCGKEFKCPTRLNKVTCSKECNSEYSKQTGRLSWESRKIDYNKKFPEITMKCSYCGKEFTKTLTAKLKKQLKEQPYKWYNCDDKHCAKMVRKANISMTKLNGRLWSNIEYRYCGVCENLYVYTEDSRWGTWEEKQYKNICYNPNCLNKYRSVSTAQQRSEAFARKREEKELVLNHKVVKVEKLPYKIDCGDIRVETYHNFAVSAGVFIHNSNKAALAHENDVFARTIVSYQQMLTRHLHSLISKMYKYIKDERLPPGITITFSPPRLLQVEREVEHFQQIQTVIQILTELGFNKEWLKRKYVNLPFDEIEEFENTEIIKSKINGKKPDEEDTMMAGGYGGATMGGGY